MARRSRKLPAWAALLLCALLVAAACALSLLLGASTLSPGEILSSLLDPASTGARILLHVRLPRLCGTLLAGAALAAAGAILADVWTDHSMPTVDNLGEDFLAYVKDGMTISVAADGTVTVEG